MPSLPIIEKVTLGPGTVGPSPGFVLHPGQEATVRINIQDKAWDAKTGDQQPSVFLDILIQRSDDGGETYNHHGYVQMVGGGRTKDGQMPAITVRNDYGDDRLYRATLTVNSRVSLGLNWEQP